LLSGASDIRRKVTLKRTQSIFVTKNKAAVTEDRASVTEDRAR